MSFWLIFIKARSSLIISICLISISHKLKDGFMILCFPFFNFPLALIQKISDIEDDCE